MRSKVGIVVPSVFLAPGTPARPLDCSSYRLRSSSSDIPSNWSASIDMSTPLALRCGSTTTVSPSIKDKAPYSILHSPCFHARRQVRVPTMG